MTIGAMLSTICGAFIFTFLLRILWGKLMEKREIIGGFFAAFIIVGTMWVINHGIKNSLIKQSGSVWIDMAWAAGIGLFTASVISGGKIKKSFVNIGAAIVGGIIGGAILTLS